MSLKGFIKISLLSLQSDHYKGEPILVKVKALDAEIQSKVTNQDAKVEQIFLLPVAEKISLEIYGNIHTIGYFQLPLKKIYDFPTKKHIISINCVTKDAESNQISPEVYGILKLSLMYFESRVAKFDIFIEKLELSEEKMDLLERCLYIEALVGNVTSQTTVKKKQGGKFSYKELLPFTLESIPGKIQFTIKDKDMVNDQIMGKLSLNPQKEDFFDQKNATKQKEYVFHNEKKKMMLLISTKFKIPQSQ